MADEPSVTIEPPAMTLRQYYAAQALTGLLSNAVLANLQGRAELCFQIADSMIAFEQAQAAGIPAVPAGTPKKRAQAPQSATGAQARSRARLT